MLDYDHDRFVRELAEVLTNDPAIGHIDLFIGKDYRLHVTGTGIRIIGGFVRSKRIEVVVDAQYLATHKADAAYQHRTNRMYFHPDWVRKRNEVDSGLKYVLSADAVNPDPGVFRQTGRRRVELVHEATHALIDYRRFDVLDRRHEAAAWLAGLVYAYHTGVLGELLGTDEVIGAHPLWQAAHAVGRAHGLYSAKGSVRLRARDLKPLLTAIAKHYDYLPGFRSWLDGIDDD